MNCKNCKAQLASTEIYCPFCGEVNEGVAQTTPVMREPVESVRCLFCTSMVPQGARFCGSCGREQTMRPQSTGSGSSGKALAWTCGSCAVIFLLFCLAVPAVPLIISLIFGSMFNN